MKVKYHLILQTKSFKREYDFLENQNIQIGTKTESHIVVPAEDGATPYMFVVCAKGKHMMVQTSPKSGIYMERETNLFELPEKVTFFSEATGSPFMTLSVELKFERRVPNYSYACQIPINTWVYIGGGTKCTIKIEDYKMEKDYISLFYDGSKAKIHVDNVLYQACINGKPIVGTKVLNSTAFFSINGYEFFYRSGYLYMDAHTKLKYPDTWKRIENLSDNSPFEYPKFNKSPRFMELLNEETIEILDPSPKQEPQKSNLIMQLLPSIIMLAVTILLRGVMGGGGLYIIISAVSMGLGIFTSIYSYFHGKKEIAQANELRITQYEDYLERKENEIEQARQSELAVLNKIFRPAKESIDYIWEFSDKLFDRSPRDMDFLQVYLGKGKCLALRKVSYQKREAIELGDELMQMPEKICEKYKYLQDAPIVSNLRNSNAIGIVGQSHRLKNMLNNMTFDLCTRQMPRDLQLFYIIDNNYGKWLRWIPHVQNREMGVRNIVCDDETKSTLLEYLYSMLAKREQLSINAPHCVVFVENDQHIKAHPLSKYLNCCASLGVSFVFFEEHKEYLPENCDEIIVLDNDLPKGILTTRANAAENYEFSYGMIDEKTAERAALQLAPIYCEEISVENSLPGSYSFFDCFQINAASEIMLEDSWKKSDVSKSLAAPIGANSRGELVYLDIHEKAHGPHGLVAGTTGSGKSEFLQSYIAAMSLRYAPDEVGFLIIDFKGGGMASQLKDLPHLVGTITNIDGTEIKRSLKSIKAELEKRQKLFDQAKVNHIDKYIRKYKERQLSIALPHLVIVVDEFAELKAAQPDFMNELISAARIGRSLGIHLILATQKPAGQVNEQIWSNSRFRLCFKVQTKADSNEMLHSPLAAEIRESGRGYLQVGNDEIFELFQSAYSGGSIENEARENIEDFAIAEVSLWGERSIVYNSAKNIIEHEKSHEITQLKAVISEMNAFCKKNKISSVPGICLPALPEKIYTAVEDKKTAEKGIKVSVGRYDDPEQQKQGNLWFDLTNGNLMIIGSAQMGKTSALQTIIRNLCERYTSSEINIYVLDFASMILKHFEGLDHVGGVAISSEEEKVQNLFRMLLPEISIRKKKLLSKGVSSYSEYLNAGEVDIPQIVLILDNFTAFCELYEEECEGLLKLCREGFSVGISVIIANSHTSGLGYRYMSNFANRISFFCYDNGEYSSLFDYCRMSIPAIQGRGLVRLDNRILEFQGYLAFEGEREVDRVNAIKAAIEQINVQNKARPARKIPVVPEQLMRSELRREEETLFACPYNIPIGMDYTSMDVLSVDLTTIGAFGIFGQKKMGKNNLIMNIVHTLLETPDLHLSEIYIADDIRKKLQSLENEEGVKRYSSNTKDADEMLNHIYDVLVERKQQTLESNLPMEKCVASLPLLVLIVSGEDALLSMDQDKLYEVVKYLSSYKVCVALTGLENESIGYSSPDILKYIRDNRKVFVFDKVSNIKVVDISYKEENQFPQEIGPGDAFGYYNDKLCRIKTILDK